LHGTSGARVGGDVYVRRVIAHSARLVSLAAGTILDVTPVEAVTVAHRAGWPACGIWYDGATWTGRTTADVGRRLLDTGTIALDVEAAIFSDDGDHGDGLVDAAIALGARFVLAASRLAPSPAVIDRFGDLCDRALAGNVTVVLEFLPIFGVASFDQAHAVVTAAGRSNAGVLVDTLHLARSGDAPTRLRGIDRHLLPYVQIADAPAAPADPSLRGLVDEALHGRRLLGDGDLDVRGVLDAVPDVPLSFELRSRGLMAAYPDPVDRARAVLENWRSYTTALPH
jgi:sugar phosphate isomerase/epimerase